MLYDPGYNDDPNRPFGYDLRRLAAADLPLGALIGLCGDFCRALPRHLLVQVNVMWPSRVPAL